MPLFSHTFYLRLPNDTQAFSSLLSMSLPILAWREYFLSRWRLRWLGVACHCIVSLEGYMQTPAPADREPLFLLCWWLGQSLYRHLEISIMAYISSSELALSAKSSAKKVPSRKAVNFSFCFQPCLIVLSPSIISTSHWHRKRYLCMRLTAWQKTS